MSIDYMRAYSNDPNATGIIPQAVSTPATLVTAPVDHTVGNGPDSYVFKLSEDAYQGDAQFTIAVDGKQQGGVMTTRTLHSAGQSQTFTVKDDFDSFGQHRATISFINDAWGGSDATDRKSLRGCRRYARKQHSVEIDEGDFAQHGDQKEAAAIQAPLRP